MIGVVFVLEASLLIYTLMIASSSLSAVAGLAGAMVGVWLVLQQ